MRWSLVAVTVAMLCGCGSSPQPAPSSERAAPPPAPAKPADESARFPQADLSGTEVVNTHLLGKAFMPGGTLAHYKKGKRTYDLFLAETPSAQDAAIVLLSWKDGLSGAEFVPSFGGYFGKDGSEPVFVFTKGKWIAGVKGLPQKEADANARVLASKI